MSYADIRDELHEAREEAKDKGEAEPDVDYSVEFYGTRAERDKDFLNKLCKILEDQGLSPVAVKAEEKPKKARKVKQFVAGDIITKANMRDLPLPAHVRLNVEREDEKTKQWIATTVEQVVTELRNDGHYYVAHIKDGKATKLDSYFGYESKTYLEGANYLGPWAKKITNIKDSYANRQELSGFYYRPKQKQPAT